MDKTDAITAFAALAQETRLDVVRLLVGAGPEGMAAGAIGKTLNVPHNTLSTHLAALTRAGLIRARREGRSMIYAPDFEGVRALVGFLMQDCCNGRPEICLPVIEALQAMRCDHHQEVPS